MAMNSLGLGFIFTAKDLASGVLTKVEGKFKKLDATTRAAQATFKKNVGQAIGGLGLMAGGTLALAGAANLANQFGKFEYGLAKVGAISKATTGEIDQLKEAAIQAGLKTQFSPTEAVQGLEELATRGFTAQESMTALNGSLNFAAGGQLSIAKATSTTASALRVFGKDASYAEEASDKLLRITNLTSIKSHELEKMLGNVSRGAILSGQGFDEMLIAMGLVRNVGVPATVAASSVSAAIQGIGKNASKFRELGIEVTKSDGTFKDFIDIVLEAEPALSKIKDQAERSAKSLELFGRFGVTSMAALTRQINTGMRGMDGKIRKGAEAIEYLRHTMRNAKGAGEEFKKKLLETFQGQKILLGGAVQTLGVIVGESFAHGFKSAVSFTYDAITALVDAFRMIPLPIRKAMGSLFLILVALTLVAGAVMFAVAGFALLKMAVLAFAGPLLAVAGVLAGVAAAGMLLYTVFSLVGKGFRENIGGFGNTISDVFGRVRLFFQAVNQLMSGDGKLRGDVLLKLLDPANKGILNMLQRFQQGRYRAQKFFEGIRDGANVILTSAAPTFAALGDAVKELFAALGFGGKSLDLFTSKSEDYRLTGAAFGAVLGEIARLLIGGVTVAVRIATGAVRALQTVWAVLGFILLNMVLPVFWGIAVVLGPVLNVLASIFDAGNSQGFMWMRLSHIVGVALGLFVAYRAVMIGVRIAMLAYRAALLIAAVAQGAFSAVVSVGALAFLGPVGLAVGLAAVGVALAGWLVRVAGGESVLQRFFNKVVAGTHDISKLDEAYRKTLETRDQARAFSNLEEAAKAEGMSVEDYANKRAKKISGEKTAQALGLSEGEIKRRLLAGEDVYKEIAKKATPAAAAADGQVAAANGEANKAKAQAQLQGDATADALERAQKGGVPVKLNVTTKIGGEQVANWQKEVEASIAAANFEIDALPLGEF